MIICRVILFGSEGINAGNSVVVPWHQVVSTFWAIGDGNIAIAAKVLDCCTIGAYQIAKCWAASTK